VIQAHIKERGIPGRLLFLETRGRNELTQSERRGFKALYLEVKGNPTPGPVLKREAKPVPIMGKSATYGTNPEQGAQQDPETTSKRRRQGGIKKTKIEKSISVQRGKSSRSAQED